MMMCEVDDMRPCAAGARDLHEKKNVLTMLLLVGYAGPQVRW